MRMPVDGRRRADPSGPRASILPCRRSSITAYTADNELEAARREGLLGRVVQARSDRAAGRRCSARRAATGSLLSSRTIRALADNLTEALRGRGFAAITASRCIEAESLGVRPFAGIVDLRVPGGPDGEAMRRLAATFPGLPLVVITALDIEPPALPRACASSASRSTRGALLDAVERRYRNAHA